MSKDLYFLNLCDTQINGLMVHQPDSQRLTFLTKVVRPDIVSRLPAEDVKQYEINRVAQQAARGKMSPDDLARMNANKDSESI